MSGQTPVERAARAMHADQQSDPWDREHPYLVEEYRHDARVALTAALDVDELAEVVWRALYDWQASESPVTLRPEFIAHARADIPALIGEVERLRAERDRAEATIARVRALVADTGNTSTGPTYALCADVLAAIEGTDS